jgi:hypothetical protein
MTVQTVAVIRDRILYADYGHKMAVFGLPKFIYEHEVEDGEHFIEAINGELIHNEFKYTREHINSWFDAFFDDTVMGSRLVAKGHTCGGKLLGVYGKKDIKQFDEDIFKTQLTE